MIDIEINQKEKKGIIFLTGNLSIQNISELKKSFLKIISKVNHISINMRKISSIDIPSLQIILSAIKTIKKARKRIKIILKNKNEFKELLLTSGFTNNFFGS